MKHKRRTVSIFIPAHNEESNIGNLLESLGRQQLRGGIISHIWILCDGCTDETVSIARAYKRKNSRVIVVDDNKHLGKHRRLVTAFAKDSSDIQIVFDGDTLLAHKRVVHMMVSPFSNPKVTLVGGNNIPVSDRGLENYLLNAWTMFWFGIKQHVRDGNNIHNVRSCCLAMRKSLTARLKWPDQLLSHGQFLYLTARSHNMSFVFVRDAVVWYRNPTTFSDYAIQKKRGQGRWKDFAERFGHWVYEQYDIPIREKIPAMVAVTLRHPINTFFAVLCRVFLSIYFLNKKDMQRDHFWKVAASTKQGIALAQFRTNDSFFTF